MMSASRVLMGSLLKASMDHSREDESSTGGGVQNASD